MHEAFANSLSSPRSDASSAFSSPIPFKRTKLNTTSINNQNSVLNRNENNVLGVTGKELEEIYRNSRRCGEIENNLRRKKWRMASFRATVQAADLIFSHWESPSSSEDDSIYRERKQHFVNYVVGFVMRVGPCVTTLLHGLLYCLKLRQIYPQAHGEQGCSHRLFVVSLLVATRYLNDRQVLIKPNHSTWSTLSGIFTSSELERMEIEFVTFLRGKLFIGLSEIERCVEDFFVSILSDFGQVDFGCIVPGSVDWLELISVYTIKSHNYNDSNEAFVP